MCLLIKVVRNPCEIFLAALDSAEKALYESITRYSLCVLSYYLVFDQFLCHSLKSL